MRSDCPQLEILRNEVINGRITEADIVKRLTAAIEAEYEKPQPNVNFLNLCEDLLWDIGTRGRPRPPSPVDRYLALIKQYTLPDPPEPTSSPLISRFAVITMVIVLILVLTGGAMCLRWFTHSSSPDEQQYVVKGHEISLDMIKSCIADHQAYAVLQTPDWSKVCEFVGFEPDRVRPEAFGTSAVQYNAYIEPEVLTVYTQYGNDVQNPVATLSMHYFADFEESLLMFEQDQAGEQLFIGNCKIYITTNMERISFAWISENCVYILPATLTVIPALTSFMI